LAKEEAPRQSLTAPLIAVGPNKIGSSDSYQSGFYFFEQGLLVYVCFLWQQ
jgi:hypothetical protein